MTVLPDQVHDVCMMSCAALVMLECWHYMKVDTNMISSCGKGCLDAVQGGKAKMSMHMGELVEGDFTHKSENTQPKKQSQSNKVHAPSISSCSHAFAPSFHSPLCQRHSPRKCDT